MNGEAELIVHEICVKFYFILYWFNSDWMKWKNSKTDLIILRYITRLTNETASGSRSCIRVHELMQLPFRHIWYRFSFWEIYEISDKISLASRSYAKLLQRLEINCISWNKFTFSLLSRAYNPTYLSKCLQLFICISSHGL